MRFCTYCAPDAAGAIYPAIWVMIQPANRRLLQWQRDGTWQRIWLTFLSNLNQAEKVDWSQAFLDGSFVPAKRGARV